MAIVKHRRVRTAGIAVLSAALLAGCHVPRLHPPESTPTQRAHAAGAPLPEALRRIAAGEERVDFLLLGEIHDHPLHHRLRVDWLAQVAPRWRFSLAMEQFDADRQGDIDRARAQRASAREIAQAAGFDFKGWDWAHYEPFVALALRFDLPLVAANLSARQAREIARGGAHPMAQSEPPGWGREDTERLVDAVQRGHCGMLPASALAPMAAAQRARDATIAQALADARRANGLPVVLVTGNGHVRRDLGVPRHLAGLAPQARVFAVGLIERDDAAPAGAPQRLAQPFDLVIETPAHPRPDPCEVFRARRG